MDAYRGTDTANGVNLGVLELTINAIKQEEASLNGNLFY